MFGILLGTPRWASPEQVRGEEVDHRTDLFAVGLLLFTALAGRTPHRTDDFESVITTLAHGRLPKLASLAPGVDSTLCDIVDRALEPDRARRWQSAGEMRAALMATES